MQENHNTNLPQQLINAKWIVLIKLQSQAVDRSFLWQFPLTVSQSYTCVRVSFQVDGTVDASLHSLVPRATRTPGSSDKKGSHIGQPALMTRSSECVCIPWEEEHVAQRNKIPTYQKEYVIGVGHRHWGTETPAQTPTSTPQTRSDCSVWKT